MINRHNTGKLYRRIVFLEELIGFLKQTIEEDIEEIYCRLRELEENKLTKKKIKEEVKK